MHEIAADGDGGGRPVGRRSSQDKGFMQIKIDAMDDMSKNRLGAMLLYKLYNREKQLWAWKLFFNLSKLKLHFRLYYPVLKVLKIQPRPRLAAGSVYGPTDTYYL